MFSYIIWSHECMLQCELEGESENRNMFALLKLFNKKSYDYISEIRNMFALLKLFKEKSYE